MSNRLFGTDGIRGAANRDPMTSETAMKAGMATGLQFRRGRHRHRALIGKDTRLSGYMLEAALTAGFLSVGVDVISVGPMPTPAVAMLTRSMRCDVGVMLSASHNPFEDNGIKLFGPDGFKLSDEAEQEIEMRIFQGMDGNLAQPWEVGKIKRLHDVQGRYTEFVKYTFPRGQTLAGMRIVVDCANGAAYAVAPEVLYELGADIVPISVSPDGFNINRRCGSTSPEQMCQTVIEYRADFGIALDGDADRVVISDENGTLIDGDQLMALVANNWSANGRLRGGGVVATVMSNMGLERYLNGVGLTLERTQVGDRHVVEFMRARGFNLGGEQSGHIILSDYTTTGDGLIAALQVLAVVVSSGRRASDVCRVFEPLPQVLRSIRFSGDKPLEHDEVKSAIDNGRRRLGNSGRLLIRKSGTEPVIRVMAEGEHEDVITDVVDDICGAIRSVSVSA